MPGTHDRTGDPIEVTTADEAKAAIRAALCKGEGECEWDHEHTVRADPRARPIETIDPKEGPL